MYNEIITFYSKNPFHKFEMEDCTVSFFEENDLCWDELNIFLKIEDNKIIDWSFTWDTAIITTACSWIFGESIIWKNLNEVLKLNYSYVVELIESEVTERRKKASVLGLLATKNAIHKYLNDWIKDDFDDIFPN
jgi:nitrogen fixation NifU-like protein